METQRTPEKYKSKRPILKSPSSLLRPVSPARQRKNGIYYTPRQLSDILCDWAIREPSDLIFEPSFGGCVFIESILSTLRLKRNLHPERNVFGCDTDRGAFRYLESTVSEPVRQSQFLLDDFLKLTPKHFHQSGFDVVMGNPPYVSLHNMKKKQKTTASLLQSPQGIVLEKRASLWAYFVLHGLSFLNKAGRLALVLPGSLIHSVYGRGLLHQLAIHFSQVSVISITEHYFTTLGADESTELLLCEGWLNGPAPRGVEIGNTINAKTCHVLVKRWKTGKWKGPQLNGQAVPYLIQPTGSELLENLRKCPYVRPFGDFTKIRIGVVTGANRFFIVSKSAARASKLPKKALRFILTKLKICTGISLRKSDATRAIENQLSCLLVYKAGAPKHPSVIKYFRKFPSSEKATNKTFKKRKHWSEPDLGNLPHAFLSYMNHRSPRFIFNVAKANSTNTVHRIYFLRGITELQRLLVAISFHSTITQLSAEFEGRVYGSGVLKLEPNEATKLLVVIPPRVKLTNAKRTVVKIDRLLRAGKAERATLHADNFLAKHLPKEWTKAKMKKLRLALITARTRRYPQSKAAIHNKN